MPDTITAALDEIRERWAKVEYVQLKPEVVPDVGPQPSYLADVSRLLAALGEVLKLHVPASVPDSGFCNECGVCYPCLSVRAISRALLGGDPDA